MREVFCCFVLGVSNRGRVSVIVMTVLFESQRCVILICVIYLVVFYWFAVVLFFLFDFK